MNSLYEIQKMRQWWLVSLLILLMCVPAFAIVQQSIFHKPFGDNPMPNWGLFITLAFSIGINWLLLSAKLETRIDAQGIQMKYWPFISTWRHFSWDDIASAEMIQYRFVGYGIRWHKTYHTIYNTHGNKGIFIQLKNHKKFVIGTNKDIEAQKILAQYQKSKSA